MDILFGGEVFSKPVLHGRRFSPTGVPSAFKMCFGWVLNGEANRESQQRSTQICGLVLDIDSKGIDKTLVSKIVRWRMKKSKNREVLACGTLAPEYTISGIFLRYYLCGVNT